MLMRMQKFYEEGSILLDAPQHDTMDELVELARDKEEWQGTLPSREIGTRDRKPSRARAPRSTNGVRLPPPGGRGGGLSSFGAAVGRIKHLGDVPRTSTEAGHSTLTFAMAYAGGYNYRAPVYEPKGDPSMVEFKVFHHGQQELIPLI